MQPHEQRVVDERNELTDKLTKLTAFFDTVVFEKLPDQDRALLLYQCEQMNGYLNTLQRRIGRFASQPH